MGFVPFGDIILLRWNGSKFNYKENIYGTNGTGNRTDGSTMVALRLIIFAWCYIILAEGRGVILTDLLDLLFRQFGLCFAIPDRPTPGFS